MKYCMPKNASGVGKLCIIFDSYRDSIIKQLTQMRRGKSGRNVYITNMKQKIPKNKDWHNFRRNSHNKTEMISAIVGYCKSKEFRARLDIPILITEEDHTWLVSKTGIDELPSSNHIVADTRIILEALKSTNVVVVIAADTDILILMCYAHSVNNCSNEWVMNIDSEKYVSKIQTHFGNKVCNVLPAFHSITGCDTISYAMNIGKVKPFKKMIKLRKEDLLLQLGSNIDSVKTLEDSKMFFHTGMYSGSVKDSTTETRTKMYLKQKIKSSLTLIPDGSSVLEHLKRADLQTLIWKRCSATNMVILELEGRGWEEEDGQIIPIWFESMQLPPSLVKQPRRKNSYGIDSDQEVLPTIHGEPAARRKRKDVNLLNPKEDESSDSDVEQSNGNSSQSNSDDSIEYESDLSDSDIDMF